MPRTIHFISGLPRAGSTLLSALLSQNPRFRASMSSAVSSLFFTLQREMSQGNEYAIFIDDEQRKRVLRSVIEAYYAHLPPETVVFDTSRGWTTKVTALDAIYPDVKIICCVRNIAWILDSIESLVRRNCLQPAKMFAFDAGGTVYSRTESLVGNAGLVGASLFGLREAVFSDLADRLLLVRYETLTREPLATLEKIYAFLGEPCFQHDPNNVPPNPEAEEFDARLGMPGLHSVGRVVRATPRRSILPTELFSRYEAFTFWEKPNEMPAGIRVV